MVAARQLDEGRSALALMPKRKRLTKGQRERAAYDRLHPFDKMLAGVRSTEKHVGRKGAYQKTRGGTVGYAGTERNPPRKSRPRKRR